MECAGQAIMGKKYPRTYQLVDLGAATPDDKVASAEALGQFLSRPKAQAGDADYVPLFIEEKIDGANLGFSMDPTDFSIRAQNRAHVVCEGLGEQWKGLSTWVDEHRSALYKLLEPFMGSDSAPGAKPGELDEDIEAEGVAASSTSNRGADASDVQIPVLYGEWVKIRHSMFYDRLPGYFVAFDLWTGDRFLTRAELHTLLSNAYDDTTGERIPVVPILHKGPLYVTNMDDGAAGATKDLEHFVEAQVSRFKSAAMAAPGAEKIHGDKTGQHAEGIVLRRELPDGQLLKMKVVRAAFKQGIAETGHFIHQATVTQVVDEEFKWSYPEECFTQAA